MDTDRGLIVPVIRDVDRKSITQLALELNDLAARGRAAKIEREELSRRHLHHHQHRRFGGTGFTPIVNYPEVAILGMARASLQPVVKGTGDNFEMVPRLMLPLILGFDHRVVDGADAARFLGMIMEALGNPEQLLMMIVVQARKTIMVMGEFTQETDLLVIGGGPGGYAAAFRAADLGLDVTVVDSGGRLGGVCLFRGCIPSKTLLHVSELLYDAHHADEMGVTFGDPKVDLDRLRQWKNQVIEKLANGLVELSKKRSVQVLNGRAVFESSERARLQNSETGHIRFRHAIIATGSTAALLCPRQPSRKAAAS